MKRISVKKLGQILVGRTIQSVAELPDRFLNIYFTDGTYFSFEFGAKPTCALTFFPDKQDNTEIVAEMRSE